jgi:riboflavin kinase/FMN adenylyltransferase
MQHSIRLGFAVHEIPACIIHQNTVSSTKIRNHLINNELDKANDLLGYPYHIAGTVVQGDQLGRTIGFPTANIGSIQPHKLIPAQGIYAVRVLHDHHYYNGMFYIGSRPTLTNTTPETRLEVFIFDFDKNVYEHNICVELIKHLRPDQKFDGLEALKNQLKADQVQAMACLV